MSAAAPQSYEVVVAGGGIVGAFLRVWPGAGVQLLGHLFTQI